MRIAILGTRGIPNQYGGFEQFAEILSTELVKRGHEITVYNPHFHYYKEKNYQGVKIIRKYNPEDKIGSAANFIYDLLCLRDATKRGYDIYLELGYQSASISYFFFKPKNGVLITNMDGLEWKRAKWSNTVKAMTKKFENWGVMKSDHIVADNIGIQEYLYKKYQKPSTYIAYPVDIVDDFKEKHLYEYNLQKSTYYLLIARLEPENNIEIIIEGYIKSHSDKKLIIIGGYKSAYGNYLYEKFKDHVLFLGPVYNKKVLDSLRYYASIYFHGHSVGGTNPSLLEAMASKSFIVAHDNEFNRNVLSEGHLYFSTKNNVSEIIQNYPYDSKDILIKLNLKKIRLEFNKDKIIADYLNLFEKVLKEK